MLWWLLVGAGVLVACALLYNRLVRLRNRVDNAWSQVDVQLKRLGLNVGALISLAFFNFVFFAIGVAIVWVISRRFFSYSGSALNQLWVRRTLKGALLHAPAEVAQGGSFYSPGYGVDVAEPTGLSFSDLENGFSSAFTPPSSSSSGGGGSFSGGGGGAW